MGVSFASRCKLAALALPCAGAKRFSKLTGRLWAFPTRRALSAAAQRQWPVHVISTSCRAQSLYIQYSGPALTLVKPALGAVQPRGALYAPHTSIQASNEPFTKRQLIAVGRSASLRVSWV